MMFMNGSIKDNEWITKFRYYQKEHLAKNLKRKHFSIINIHIGKIHKWYIIKNRQ